MDIRNYFIYIVLNLLKLKPTHDTNWFIHNIDKDKLNGMAILSLHLYIEVS